MNNCVVPKLFPTPKKQVSLQDVEVMKLTPKKIKYIIRHKERGRSSLDIAYEIGVTKRRVNQIYQLYERTGHIPVIGQNIGRPLIQLTNYEKEIVKDGYDQYRFGARMLEPIIRKMYHVRISHNRIHKYLLELGYAKENEKKKKRRRWVRYERKHTLSAGHIDWHEKGMDNTNVCAIIDDSCRKILSGGEYESINTSNSKKIVMKVVENYFYLRPMRELIMDRGSEFGAHRTNE